MIIGYDAKRLFANFTGLGNYSRTLIKNLMEYYSENEIHLYSSQYKLTEETESFFRDPTLHNHQIKPYQRSLRLGRVLKADSIQIFHGLSNELPLDIQLSKIKSIVSIHDLIFKIYPETYPIFDRIIYDYKFKQACKLADKVIAISENTKNDILKYYNCNPEKIEVIYQSCNPIYFDNNSNNEANEPLKNRLIPKEYLLYVGSIEKRKNLELIIKSYPLLNSKLQIPLVVVGSGKHYFKDMLILIQKLKLENKIIFLNKLANNRELRQLYQNAQALIYPSIYEGFGIPIIEALLSRCPVISSRVSSLPEAGGPDSIYINPQDAESLADGIQKVLCDSNLRRTMIDKGEQYARNYFNAAKISKQWMDTYQKLL